MAEQLHRSVAELRATMGNDEFVMWTRYFSRKAQREELERLKAGI